MAIQNSSRKVSSFPSDLILTQKLIYTACNLTCTEPKPEPESAEYGAFRFQIDNQSICYREAKITPTKTGQFVTLWKRNNSGIIAPFDYLDTIDFVMVSVRKEDAFGQFIFPKRILLEKGIFSTSAKEGKRAIRVYPPWDITTSKQAQKTQEWQLAYFIKISKNESIVSRTKLLLGF